MVGGTIVIILMLGLLFQLVLVQLTYKDAKRRGHNPNKWGVLTFIFGIIAIIIYLLTRNPSEVPEEERHGYTEDQTEIEGGGSGKDMIVLIAIVFVISVSILSAVIAGSIGGAVAKSVYEMPENDRECDTYRMIVEPSKPTPTPEKGVCYFSHDDKQEAVEKKRSRLTGIFQIVGFGLPIIALLGIQRQYSIQIEDLLE